MEIVVAKSLDDINQIALKELIERGFGKRLVEGYFNNIDPVAFFVAVNQKEDIKEGPYKGAIVIVDPHNPYSPGLNYADKMIVAEEHRGNGVFSTLWDEVKNYNPKLFWRAKKTNPANELYKSIAGEPQITLPWNVYSIGLKRFERNWARNYAIALPESLVMTDEDGIDEKVTTSPIIIPGKMPQVPLSERVSGSSPSF